MLVKQVSLLIPGVPSPGPQENGEMGGRRKERGRWGGGGQGVKGKQESHHPESLDVRLGTVSSQLWKGRAGPPGQQ